MRCYFHGSVITDNGYEKQKGMVSFAIPDIGVIFRSRWDGNLYECQYASLLSLLRFIETNSKLFKGKSVEILSDASVVIYQLTKKSFIFKSLEPYYRMVQTYKAKFAFKLNWIPDNENPANHGLSEIPPIRPSVEINYDIKQTGNDDVPRGGALPL